MSRTKIDATCLHCKERREYQPKAFDLQLFTHGVVQMQFFCAACRELNAQQVPDEIAEAMSDVGVSTTIVVTPGEVLEWPPLTVRNICDQDCLLFELMSIENFNERLRKELV